MEGLVWCKDLSLYLECIRLQEFSSESSRINLTAVCQGLAKGQTARLRPLQVAIMLMEGQELSSSRNDDAEMGMVVNTGTEFMGFGIW